MKALSASARTRTRTGQLAEDLACRWLKKRRLELIERNYRCALGELDIIAREHELLIFVEVRYRRNVHCVRSADTLGYWKIARLLATIDHYMQKRAIDPTQAWRLDALGMEGALKNPVYHWIQDIAL